MDNAANPKVTVVILSYSRPQCLAEALDSVLKQTYKNLEVLLIDNRSPRSTEISALARSYPTVRLIANTENVGFTQAMNQGVNAANGDYVFLTEDDIVLDSNCIAAFVRYALLHPDVAILSGIQYDKTSGTVWCAGATIELGPVFRTQLFRRGEPDVNPLPEPYETQFVPGCMIFATRSYLNQMGPFRADFFMYFEDTEFCIRARRHGDRIVIVPECRCWHFTPKPGETSDEVDFHRIKNFFSLYILHAPLLVLPEFFARYFLLDILRSTFHDPRRARLMLRAAFHLAGRLTELLPARRVEVRPTTRPILNVAAPSVN